MSIDKTTASRSRQVRHKRPLDPAIEALLYEGALANSDEGLELSELFAEASWEALQIADPDPVDLDGLVWPEKK